jgi:hypothetical protein
MRASVKKKSEAGQNAERVRTEQTQAAIVIQAAARGRAGRLAVHSYRVEQANQKGEMLAMPGTALGQNEWYQKGTMVHKADAIASGEFVQLSDGIDEPLWRRIHLPVVQYHHSQQQQKQNEKQDQLKSRWSLKEDQERLANSHKVLRHKDREKRMILEAEAPHAVKIQSLGRGMVARRRRHGLALVRANCRGEMLAMPGTTHGHAGWYQAGELVFQYDLVPAENGPGAQSRSSSEFLLFAGDSHHCREEQKQEFQQVALDEILPCISVVAPSLDHHITRARCTHSRSHAHEPTHAHTCTSARTRTHAHAHCPRSETPCITTSGDV